VFEPHPHWGARARTAPRLAAVGLVLCAVASLALYWLLWTPAYRLTERFEYPDLLFGAFPGVAHVLAAQLALVQALLPTVLATYEGTRVFFAGLLVALFAVYAIALGCVRQAPRRLVVGMALATTLASQVVLLPLPGLVSTDLFSYAFYGEVAGRLGGSPYVEVPNDYPTNPLYLLINPLWRDAPSVYGPVWIAISGVVGALWGGQVLPQVLAYRVLADLVHWLNLGLIWWTLRRLRPGAEPWGLALYAWSPLVVFEFAANGHNDGLLIAFLLLSMGLLARGRDWLGAGALLLSVATKYTTVLLLPLMLWWAARGWPFSRRLGVVALAGLGATGIVALLYLPWWRGPATFGPIIYWVSNPLYAHYAPVAVGYWLRDLLVHAGWLGWEDAEYLTFGLVRYAGRLAFLVYLAAEALRLRRPSDLPLACARVMLVFLLVVNTWVLAWYYTWPLALAALGNWRSRTAVVAVALSFTAPLSMYWAQTHLEGMETQGYFVYLAPVVGLALWEAWQRVGQPRAPAVYGALRTVSVGGRKTNCAPGSTLKK
jgi:hypothetical protein